MHYLYLRNPNIGVVAGVQEPFHHVMTISENDPLIEAYLNNRDEVRLRVRLDARLWLNTHYPNDYRAHCDHRMIAFRSKETALLFKLTWG